MRKHIVLLFLFGLLCFFPMQQIFAEEVDREVNEIDKIEETNEKEMIEKIIETVDEEKGLRLYTMDGFEFWFKVISYSYVDENGVEYEYEMPKTKEEYEECLRMLYEKYRKSKNTDNIDSDNESDNIQLVPGEINFDSLTENNCKIKAVIGIELDHEVE